jgi:pyruvate,water dikinase
LDNLYWLDHIQSSELPLVGKKAFHLSQLLQRGYPVIPGFVIPTSVFWELIQLLGESEPLLADLPHSSFHVDVDNPRQLQRVAQHMRQAIANVVLPPCLDSLILNGNSRAKCIGRDFAPFGIDAISKQ